MNKTEWEIYNCDYRELGDLEEKFGEFVIVTVLCDGCHQKWEAKVNRIRSLL